MTDFYNLYIYDISFKLRSIHNLNLNLACDLNLNYVNVEKGGVVTSPAVRGAIILDSLSLLNNLRSKYSYYSDDFKLQTVKLNIFFSNQKIPFFDFFYKAILNDPRIWTELSYNSKFTGTTTLVTLSNLNMLMKSIDDRNLIATSGIDFGESLSAKFIFFSKKKSHIKLLNSLIKF